MKLSIVMPCYNEERTLAAILDRVLAVPLPEVTKEVIIVDDGSRDRSPEIAAEYAARFPEQVRALRQPTNRGKGAAVHVGLAAATGDILLIQDADLEYEPNDYAPLLAKFADPKVMVVYGSRILGSQNRSYNRYYWGGRLVTLATNLLYGCHLTDEPTCYKVFRRQVLQAFDLVCPGFEFCPELTAKLIRRGFRIHEIPIQYYPRKFEEGKKIRWHDGVIALWTLLRFRWY